MWTVYAWPGTSSSGRVDHDRLLTAIRDRAEHAGELRGGPASRYRIPPSSGWPCPAIVLRPYRTNVGEAVTGRVTAGMITPYRPGVPAVLPGERITEPVVRYLCIRVEAGMVCPDAVDPTVRSLSTDGAGPSGGAAADGA